MAKKIETELRIPLTNGILDRTLDEAIDPTQNVLVSTNTRFSRNDGQTTKAPGLTAYGLISDQPTFCAGLVPGGLGQNTCAYFLPSSGNQWAIGDQTLTKVQATAKATGPQNGYWPLQVSDAGIAHAGRSTIAPNVCCKNGLMWTVDWVQNGGLSQDVYVSVRTSPGSNVLISRQFVANVSGLATFANITDHDSYGVFLWLTDSTNITVRKLTLFDPVTGNLQPTITVGSPTTVYAPLSLGQPNVDVVASRQSNFAWIGCRDASNANAVRLIRWDVSTQTTSATQQFTGWGAAGYVVVACAQLSQSNEFCAIAAGDSGALTSSIGVVLSSGASLPIQWSATGRMSYGPLAIGITGRTVSAGAEQQRVFLLCSHGTGDIGTSTAQKTDWEEYDLKNITMVVRASGSLPWMQVCSRGSTWYVPNTLAEYYAFFTLARQYHKSSAPFCPDPAIELVSPFVRSDESVDFTPLGRFAVDNDYTNIGFTVGRSLCTYETQAVATHLTQAVESGFNSLNTPRFVRFELENTQVRSVMDSSGLALIAAAQPAYWDGAETVENGPLFMPALASDLTGGGDSLTGTYSFRAIYEWRDATGQLHRSAPSLPVTVTLTAQRPRVYVTAPFSMRSGQRQDDMTVLLYATVWDAVNSVQSELFYLNSSASSSGATNGALGFSVSTPTFTKPLYSLGTGNDEVPPEALPALWDAAIINGRIWAIPAEDRSLVLYSKRKDQGPDAIALEFAASLFRIPLPAGAGRLQAVADLNGTPLLLTDRAAFIVEGAGPDATDGGGDFAPARLLAPIGCTSRDSVLKTPAGVIFASNQGRFVLIGTDGSARILRHLSPGGERAAGVFPVYDEAVWCIGQATWLVYNYAKDAWSTWDNFTLPGVGSLTVGTLVQHPRGYTLFFDPTVNRSPVWMYPTTAPNAGNVTVVTPWILPAGGNGDLMVREVWLRALRGGAHSITIQVDFDFDTSTPITQTWSDTELQAVKTNQNYYTVAVALERPCRAFKLTIAESNSTGEGLQLLDATVYYGVDQGGARRALPSGAVK